MEKDKQHLQNIDKVEIHEHVDTWEILSLLHILKVQNNKILHILQSSDDTAQLEKQMDRWLVRLNKSVGIIEKVSDQVK